MEQLMQKKQKKELAKEIQYESGGFQVRMAIASDRKYVKAIQAELEAAANTDGTGIAMRSTEYLHEKMLSGKAIIALHEHQFAGFCYIESWQDKTFVANSGLIVVKKYQGYGLASEIKQKAFVLSARMFPGAKIFGLTTSPAVLKINSDLGYRPVTFQELTTDDTFWKGCETCRYYDILQRTHRQYCLCTGMLLDPQHEDTFPPLRVRR